MPLIQKPITDTIGYTFETALADAQRFVNDYPLHAQPPATRVFMHAMLDYFKELGVGRAERDAILAAYVAATGAVWTDAFNKGWDAGFDVGARQNTPPF